MNKFIIIGAVVITLLTGIYFFSNSQENPPKTVAQQDEPAVVTEKGMEDMEMQDGKMMKDEMAMEGDEVNAEPAEEKTMKTGSYTDYSPSNLTKATTEGKAVLFFHASWCPTCKKASEAFTSQPEAIPQGVTLLKTDYDTEKELKTKYGVTYQHTFVQVDAQGNEIAKWNGGDIEELIKNIQ
jgi:thiol-disulfide isomerase/thioredoxin